jgi:2-iminobutanoate/2-iminopropanoate deaminase
MLELFDDVAAMKQVNAKFGLKNTPVIRAGDLYYCSGLTALDLDSGGITAGDDIREHARVTLEDLEKILAEAGLGLDNVIKVNAYLADPVGDFAGWNEVYLEKFAAPYPCRTTVGAQLHVGVIELDVIAAREARR